MVVGVGLDLVEIARIERAMRHPRFLPRILTAAERDICRTPSRVAGRWAAKEAVAKALSIKLSWQQVEILPGPDGAPMASVSSPLFDAARSRLHVAITHERSHAAAVAVVSTVGN